MVDQIGEDRLPVANRFGQVDKASFVRLDGDDVVLRLQEDPEGAREVLGPAVVAICPIDDADWDEEGGQDLENAPPWDAEACVVGVEADDGWSFDLSAFDERSGDRGFALVPGPDAPFDFQVTFEAPG